MITIDIDKVTKTFNKINSIEPITALSNFSLQVHENEFICILGPSGCGKTTLINLIAGLLEPTDGSIKINDNKINGPSSDRTVIFQDYQLFHWKTVWQNIEIGLKAKKLDKHKRTEIIKYYFDLVDLEGFENHYPHELSGGMRQRAAIARAFAVDPKIILMDEPFGQLDIDTRKSLEEKLIKIWERKKKTIIMVTHNIGEAIFLADRIALLSHRPGFVKEIIDIHLPRPRDYSIRSTKEFLEIEATIWNKFSSKSSQSN
ncbi:MAG: ABC transporter ATP-binding protein [Ignavibacteriales bacterium]|nr:ABC transporter ATP-binding protein [Ignavibacteriales bacterium]